MQDAAPAMNVRENWPIYDTVQIRRNVEKPGGYLSFADLANVDDIPFFTTRKRDVGLAYTNRDSNEALEFAYRLKSLGVSFRAPVMVTPFKPPAEQGGDPIGRDNPMMGAAWLDLLNHCAIILKIREDNKLESTLALTPDGTGNLGLQTAGTIAGAGNVSMGLTNGWPDNRNRWTWSGEGIQIPRGATFSAVLRFSTYAKQVLNCLPNPADFLFNATAFDQAPKPDCVVPSCALIRVSLDGWRDVQQRGELHY